MIKNLFIITIISSIFLTACSSTKQNNILKNETTLINTYWKAISLNGKKAEGLVKEPHIKFEEDGKVFGNLGCNNFFSSYKVDNDKLTLGQAGSTMMMCPNMDTERAFSEVIKDIETYKIEDKTLLFFDKSAKEIAKFIKE